MRGACWAPCEWRRYVPGPRGNRGATLLGGFGQKGVLLEHLEHHLTGLAVDGFSTTREATGFALQKIKINCAHLSKQ